MSRYELARYAAAKVSIDYHVVVAEHLNSVPHALVGQTVETRITARAVEILHGGGPPAHAEGRVAAADRTSLHDCVRKIVTD